LALDLNVPVIWQDYIKVGVNVLLCVGNNPRLEQLSGLLNFTGDDALVGLSHFVSGRDDLVGQAIERIVGELVISNRNKRFSRWRLENILFAEDGLSREESRSMAPRRTTSVHRHLILRAIFDLSKSHRCRKGSTVRALKVLR